MPPWGPQRGAGQLLATAGGRDRTVALWSLEGNESGADNLPQTDATTARAEAAAPTAASAAVTSGGDHAAYVKRRLAELEREERRALAAADPASRARAAARVQGEQPPPAGKVWGMLPGGGGRAFGWVDTEPASRVV